MKFHSLPLYIVILSFIFIQSCAPVYIPNSTMVFENEEEGDGFVKFRQGGYSTNLQGGYAVNDNFNIGVALNGLYTGEARIGSTTYPGVEAFEVNAVLGYYNKFTAKNIFEFNVGGGPIYYANPEGVSNYYKLFAQPTVSLKSLNDKIKMSISTRMVGVSFNYDNKSTDSTYFRGYAEPVVSLSFGKNVQFLLQSGASIPIKSDEFFQTSPFILNLGIGYKFGNKRSEFIEPFVDFLFAY